jgi:signal transduction histidine kinase
VTRFPRLDIHARIALIAVLPSLVLGLVLIAYFTSSRLADLESAHTQRGKALVRQLAAASEYGVFSGNRESLRKLTNAMLLEKDVIRVAVTSPLHELLADSTAPDYRQNTGNTPPLHFREPIIGAGVNVEDTFLGGAGELATDTTSERGEALVEMSRDSLHLEEQRLLQNAFLMVGAVLIGSVGLALRMSGGISGPILRIADIVHSFGQGNFTARVPVEGGKTLRTLAEGVNEMADKLGASRDDLQRQVDAATRELLEKKDEAERGNRAKTRFLAAASHDLRQPMHALGLFVAELGQKPHAPDTRRLVEQIAISAETMENLLDSLLDISRLDVGALDRQIKPFPLQPLLERIEVDYRREAGLRGQRLRLRPTSLWVESDPLLLERILHNLISNALRYAPAAPSCWPAANAAARCASKSATTAPASRRKPRRPSSRSSSSSITPNATAPRASASGSPSCAASPTCSSTRCSSSPAPAGARCSPSSSPAPPPASSPTTASRRPPRPWPGCTWCWWTTTSWPWPAPPGCSNPGAARSAPPTPGRPARHPAAG